MPILLAIVCLVALGGLAVWPMRMDARSRLRRRALLVIAVPVALVTVLIGGNELMPHGEAPKDAPAGADSAAQEVCDHPLSGMRWLGSRVASMQVADAALEVQCTYMAVQWPHLGISIWCEGTEWTRAIGRDGFTRPLGLPCSEERWPDPSAQDSCNVRPPPCDGIAE